MLNNKISRIIINKNVLKPVLQKAYSVSIQPLSKPNQEEEKQLKDFETLTKISKKERPKKPQRPPFAKNLFLGEFDTEILTFPQLEKEDVQSLETSVEPLQKLLKQSHMVNVDKLSNKNFRQNLSDYRAIGLHASQFMDGRECNNMESMRFLEALSEHNLRDNIIFNEQLGVQTLVKFADEQLKTKYLYPLIKGEKLSAFCMSEAMLSDANSIQTTATLSDDKKTWVINGEKLWVVNGASADFLIVFAVTEVIHRGSLEEVKLTAFLVDKDFGGITCRNKNTSMEISDITFNNTVVPVENVIGKLGKAEVILKSIISDFRLSCGPAATTLTKKILSKLAENIVDQSNDKNILYKTDAIRSRIGEICTNIYAMESISYLTSGLMDWYQDQDCELESAIVKVFCSESANKTSLTCLDLIGAPAIEDSHWCNKLHKETLNYATIYETNDTLKMLIALMGLQHAGGDLNEKIGKLRNPLFHGGYILKRMFTQRRNIEDNPKLNMNLGDYLHPSSYIGSQHLEYCIKRLEFATETLLARHGLEVINKHIELRRLADCIIDIYAMTACLGRSSRAYCVGLQHGEYEMLIAMTFCINAMERVKENVRKIYAGPHQTNDENYRTIAKTLFKYKTYFPKHPLSRNF